MITPEMPKVNTFGSRGGSIPARSNPYAQLQGKTTQGVAAKRMSDTDEYFDK